MSAWHSDFVEANEIRLHYTRTGGDKPPLVLAHGVTDDGLCEIAHSPGAGQSIRRDRFDRYMDVVRGYLAARV